MNGNNKRYLYLNIAIELTTNSFNNDDVILVLIAVNYTADMIVDSCLGQARTQVRL